ncbi:MAG TPA: hypothetical protein VGK74_14450 [Symbiobacteriaceae bacterium]|jgi:uncharacterized membrane protein
MQDWDRLAMVGVGLLVSIGPGIQGYKFWRRRRYRAAAGTAVLIVAAVAVPVLLAMLTV